MSANPTDDHSHYTDDSGGEGPRTAFDERIDHLLETFDSRRFLEGIQPSLTALGAMRERTEALLTNVVSAMVDSHFMTIDFGRIMQPMIDGLMAAAPDLNAALRLVADKMPPNWRGHTNWELMFQVIQDEGIPLTWVPRPEIIAELLAAADRDARIEVLRVRSGDVTQDCREALGQVERPDLAPTLSLAISALDSYADGHFASAQAPLP